MQKLTGLIAAPFTPMNNNGSLNLGLVEQYARKLKKMALRAYSFAVPPERGC